jgi:hypothetical protein
MLTARCQQAVATLGQPPGDGRVPWRVGRSTGCAGRRGDGCALLIWEYPRATPGEDQMDFVESMEIENGPIRRHCDYWGWFGVKVLEEDRYHH